MKQPDPAAIWEEEERLAWLRETVDILARDLSDAPLSYEEAVARMAVTRKAVLARFPMKGELYEWVYIRRFNRILAARFGRVPQDRVILIQ